MQSRTSLQHTVPPTKKDIEFSEEEEGDYDEEEEEYEEEEEEEESKRGKVESSVWCLVIYVCVCCLNSATHSGSLLNDVQKIH